jgi:hypothetical protein
MGMSLGDLFTSGLLILNAIAVLHEERFLAKRRLRPCPPGGLRAAAACLTRVWPRRARVPRSTPALYLPLSPPPGPVRRACSARKRARRRWHLSLRTCVWSPQLQGSALPCHAERSTSRHLRVPCGRWLEHQLPRGHVEPDHPQVQGAADSPPSPSSVGHCLVLLPPLATCCAPRRAWGAVADAEGFLSGPVDCEGSASGHDM